jgi:antitoxin (DNA-binding transcriptional repressor) of toxin-antitoxin stability system
LLAGAPQADLVAHCRVNAKISQSIAALWEGVWPTLLD